MMVMMNQLGLGIYQTAFMLHIHVQDQNHAWLYNSHSFVLPIFTSFFLSLQDPIGGLVLSFRTSLQDGRHAVLFCHRQILYKTPIRGLVLSFMVLSDSSVNHVWAYISVMTWPIMTKLSHDDIWPCPNMTYDFDLHMTFDLDTGVKNVICYKSLLLLQITCDNNMSLPCDLSLVGA